MNYCLDHTLEAVAALPKAMNDLGESEFSLCCSCYVIAGATIEKEMQYGSLC